MEVGGSGGSTGLLVSPDVSGGGGGDSGGIPDLGNPDITGLPSLSGGGTISTSTSGSTNSKVLSNQEGCGRKGTRTRIVGGLPILQHEYPWLCSLKKNGAHICGVTLISVYPKPTIIVGAAHCYNPSSEALTKLLLTVRATKKAKLLTTVRVTKKPNGIFFAKIEKLLCFL